MKSIARLSAYRFGVNFCERSLLPRLLPRLEPYSTSISNSSALPEVNSLLTDHELSELLVKYQIADRALKYFLIMVLVSGTFGTSQTMNYLSRFFAVVDWLALLFVILFDLGILLTWLGVYKRFQDRWKEWQNVMNREVLLDRIEYYAKVTSSSIIANIVVEIEEMKKLQKQESEKAKEYSAIQTTTMETFFQMVDERERRNQGRENRNAVLAFILGYFCEKTFDYVLTKIRR